MPFWRGGASFAGPSRQVNDGPHNDDGEHRQRSVDEHLPINSSLRRQKISDHGEEDGDSSDGDNLTADGEPQSKQYYCSMRSPAGDAQRQDKIEHEKGQRHEAGDEKEAVPVHRT